MNFQEKLQFIRKEKGITQEELAEKLGLSRQAIAKWEAGLSTPDVDNLIQLSNLLKVSIDSLLKEEECGSNLSKSFIHSLEEEVLSEEAIEFLTEAKRSTYAAKKNEVESCRPGSHDYEYSKGDYLYIDSYFGGQNFIGEEVLWIKGSPVWSMNYSGRVLKEGFSGDFLKEVLALAPKKYPFRGPHVHHNGDYTYHCIVDERIEWFQGYEEIFLQKDKVYECYFHGGKIC